MTHPAAAPALAAARRETGRLAASGTPDEGLARDALASRMEADPAVRRALDMAAADRLREHPADGPDPGGGARAGRARRLAEAERALDDLILAGELVPDGPGRVRLPGFGRSTWRAIAALRAGVPAAERRWARAVAAEPAADLGDAAPAFLAGLGPAEPGLAAAARELLAWEALRQDARDALIRATAAAGAALEMGHDVSLRALAADCADIEARIRSIDAEIDARWRAGERRAADLGP
ncbi:MAG: hypothetical protein AB7V42_15355 [Thermoleophilia bacterium]